MIGCQMIFSTKKTLNNRVCKNLGVMLWECLEVNISDFQLFLRMVSHFKNGPFFHGRMKLNVWMLLQFAKLIWKCFFEPGRQVRAGSKFFYDVPLIFRWKQTFFLLCTICQKCLVFEIPLVLNPIYIEQELARFAKRGSLCELASLRSASLAMKDKMFESDQICSSEDSLFENDQ